MKRALVKLTGDPEGSVRIEAIRSLEVLADPEMLPLLLRLLREVDEDSERRAIEGAITATCRKEPDENKRFEQLRSVYSRADGRTRIFLLRLLGRMGGGKSLHLLRAALKDPGEEIQRTALSALGDWPDATVAPDLLDIARTAEKEGHRVIAMKGYIRLLALPGNRTVEETLGKYREALQVARRPEEKKILLEGLAGVSHLDALRLAGGYLEDEALRAAANSTAVKIAWNIRGSHGAESLAVFERALNIASDDSVLGTALDGLGDLAGPEAIPGIRPFLDRAGTALAAARAIIRIAERLPPGRRKEAVVPLQAALRVSGLDAGVAGRCIQILRQAGVKVKDYAREQGFVTSWWLLGALPNPGGSLWDKKLPPEENVDLEKPVRHGKETYSWKHYHTPHPQGIVDLWNGLRQSDNVGAYLYSEVTVPRAMDVMFLLGSDDQIACWLNGKKIHANRVNRGIGVDQDRVNTRLEAGKNRILLKVLNDGDGWAACLRITDRAGMAVPLEQREQ